MTTFEIKDEDINVEEIMRQIRENIKKRRESGAYTKEMEEMINQPLQPPSASEAPGDLKQDSTTLTATGICISKLYKAHEIV